MGPPTGLQKDLSGCASLTHFTEFMLDYSESDWDDWFSSYCEHSKTRYSIHPGKQFNKRLEHDMIHIIM